MTVVERGPIPSGYLEGLTDPTLETLIAEQAIVQADKFQGRMLDEYNNYFIPGHGWRQPRSSAIRELMAEFTLDGNEADVSLPAVLAGLQSASPDGYVRWADMGGGRALAMRQAALAPELAGRLIGTNVDLFDYGFEGLTAEEMDYLHATDPDITESIVAPELIMADISRVSLPQPANLITSVEAIQYLDDPLAALCNWYNNTADNGLMLASAGHAWSGWVNYRRSQEYLSRHEWDTYHDEVPMKHFLQTLGNAGIAFAASQEQDWAAGRPELDASDFRILGLHKKPGTALQSNAKVDDIFQGYYGYKNVRYAPPDMSDGLVSVV